jgi:leader peptidase (prepilin peptidase)/N-methyltransferase
MGYGDVLIGLILGFWLGYPLIIVALVLAFYSGAFVGIIQILTKKVARDHRLAFGPFLIYGGIVTHTYGLMMLRALLKLWGVTV